MVILALVMLLRGDLMINLKEGLIFAAYDQDNNFFMIFRQSALKDLQSDPATEQPDRLRPRLEYPARYPALSPV